MPTPARQNRAARTAVRTQPPRPALPTLEVIENTLRDWLGNPTAKPPARAGPGRPAVLPAMMLWCGLLFCLLRGFSSQLELWRLLTQWGLWHFPRVDVTDMAVYKRLERTPPTAMQRFFVQVSTAIRDHLKEHSVLPYAPFAAEIRAFDQTVLDPVLRKLKILRDVPVGDHALLPGVLACSFDLRRQQFDRVQYSEDALQNEKPGAPALAEGMPKGSLFLFDLGYFSFPWFDWLGYHGYWFVSRCRQRLSFLEQHLLYAGGNHAVLLRESLVYLGAHAGDRAAYPLRLIEITWGKTVYRYLTNVLDPRLLPAWQVVALYQFRWDIEKAFDLLKTHLGLHLLWSGIANVILHQVFATLILAQVVLALRAEIAQQAGAEVREVSLVLMLRWLPRLAGMGRDPIALFIERGRQAGCIRPFRGREYQVPRVADADYHLPERAPPRRRARYNRAKENPEHARLQAVLNALPAEPGRLLA
jgi:hypothetical protein